jgi:sugar phosphate isomerase/epimerase
VKIAHTSLPPLGIAHFTTIDVEPLAYVAMAARIGYARVGLRLYPAFPGSPYYEIVPGSTLMKAVRSQLVNTGVSVYDIEFVVIDGTFDPNRLKPVLESAAELGASRLSVCCDDADPERLRSNIAALAALSQPFGVSIDIENMPWRATASFANALHLAKDSGAENVGALVDALHFTRGGAIPTDLKAAPQDRIRHFQFCDTTGPRPATNDALIAEARSGRKLPGEGTLPLAEILCSLPDGCCLSVEVPMTTHDAEDHAGRVYEAAQRVIRDFAT